MSEQQRHFPGATCSTLHPVALDRYFYGQRDGFQRKIGRAICAQCPALQHCFFMALEYPPEYGMQASYNRTDLLRMRSKHTLPDGSIDHEAAAEHLPTYEPLELHNPNGVTGDMLRRHHAINATEARHGE